MLEKEFLPRAESLELKAIGFDEPCFGYYDSEGLQRGGIFGNRENKNSLFVEPEKTNNPKISAPTFSQAFRWFREKHGLYHYVTTHDSTDFEWYVYDKDQNDWEDYTTQDTYEEAELACLHKHIQIVKKQIIL